MNFYLRKDYIIRYIGFDFLEVGENFIKVNVWLELYL